MCWQTSLTEALIDCQRLALVGVGHPLRGDDALGLALVRRLQGDCPASETVLLLEGGAAPENLTGVLRRFAPDTVLLLDAVQMGGEAGDTALIDLARVAAPATTTHTLSLRLLADYLMATGVARVLLLGMQAGDLSLSTTLTPALEQRIDAVSITLCEIISTI